MLLRFQAQVAHKKEKNHGEAKDITWDLIEEVATDEHRGVDLANREGNHPSQEEQVQGLRGVKLIRWSHISQHWAKIEVSQYSCLQYHQLKGQNRYQ